MSSREVPATQSRWPSAGALLGKELRELLSGRALWIMLLLICPFVGYSFDQAVGLYAEASRSALDAPALARGLSPLDGMLVPTFGAFYVAVTLLFPFVAIRLLGREKETGAIKLLLQTPWPSVILVAAKIAAMLVAWLLVLVSPLSALALWIALGGHLALPETANLLLGHLLYGLVVGAFALFAAALTESAATAAIAALAFAIGSLVLDFAGSGVSGNDIVSSLAQLSLTGALRTFERGLISVPLALGLAIAATSLATLTVIWLPPGVPGRLKLLQAVLVLGVTVGLIVASQQLRLTADASEDRRNSFAMADEQAVRRLKEPLTVIVHLAPEDPRYADLRRGVLDKLARAVPGRVAIRLASDSVRGRFGGGTAADSYGQVTYAYHGRVATSFSTSAEEILPLIYGLADITPPSRVDIGDDYPGHPLVADARPLVTAWFYAGLPILIAVAWLRWSHRRPRLFLEPAPAMEESHASR